MQQALMAYKNWVAQMDANYVDGQRLEGHGAFITNKNTITTDGPFLESKEIVSGYIIIEAATLEEAIEMTKGCPLLEDYMLEVRPIVEKPK